MSKIAVLSDIHDNIWNLDKALRQVRESEARTLLFLGDFCAPFVLKQIAEGFDGPVDAVFGNNDGDGRLLQHIAADFEKVTLHGIYAELTVAGREVAMIHYPEPARRIAQSGQFDLVCYGHDHIKHCEQIRHCHLVNPGEVMGRLGPATWGLYDAETHTFNHVTIG